MWYPSIFLLFVILCTVPKSFSINCTNFTVKSRSVYSCQAQDLLTVPSIPLDTQLLLLNFNRISSISYNSFPFLPRLQSLLLGAQNTNGSVYIGPQAFQNLPNLAMLDLGGNRKLSLHPDAFKGLSQLQVLILDNNGLDESILESSLFGELFSLRKLDLSFNNIRRLQPHSSFLRLGSISTIILKLNKINQLCGNDLENLRGQNLDLLDLSSNPIQVANDSLCTNPFANITLGTLDMSSMYWTSEKFEHFFDIISGAQIKNLKISHSAGLGSGFGFSNLKNPDENTFAGLSSSNVYILDISHSYISQLAPHIFNAFYKLVSLDLSSSKINIIRQAAFSGLTQLVSLNISGNLIGDITSKSFESLWSSPLKALDLSSNNIGAIQSGAMDGFLLLETLNLRDNSLNLIPPVKLPALTLVLLKQNRISDVYGLTSFCPNCSLLDLSSNRLTDLKALWDILQLSHLKVLLLNDNKISKCFLGTASTPISTTELRYLDLSDNDLGQIWKSGQCSNIFTNLARLETLSLSKNHIYSLPTELFQDLPKLQSLDLSENRLRLIHAELFTDLKALKTLNIGSNNLVTLSPSSFRHLTSLQSIDLTQTTLVCNCGLTQLWNWAKTTNVTVQVSTGVEIMCLKLSSDIKEMSVAAYISAEC
ncbi:toll-like receptor 5 [Hyperolius riggenbachi]|uniref:toll-like receptor 5 n=1 Tax=Hyperolius riggenbachi TaxID=752182 RepID=UPI0035A325C0